MIIHQKSSQKVEVGWFCGGCSRRKTNLQLIFENISGKIGFDPFGYFLCDAGNGKQLFERGFLDILD